MKSLEGPLLSFLLYINNETEASTVKEMETVAVTPIITRFLVDKNTFLLASFEWYLSRNMS